MYYGRLSGVLLHIISLPSPFGVGDMGRSAYKFVDILHEMKQGLWQILPLSTVDKHGSPYKSFSAFAGNPLLIDLEDLVNRGLLDKKDLVIQTKNHSQAVDYPSVIEFKEALLKKAFTKFNRDNADFHAFNNYHGKWLHDWALFCVLSNRYKTTEWYNWPWEFRDKNWDALSWIEHDCWHEIEYHKFVQYIFFQQWYALKSYANSKGVRIIGDIPIFVSLESSDVWSNPGEFNLDDQKKPITVAGCPPDYFSATGQLWGNPHYRWDKMIHNSFSWWKSRFEICFSLYDYVRVDHFRGFEAYWEIDAREENAINGQWIKSPGMEFFYALRSHFGELPIVVEDLGTITEEVYELRDHFGFPGSKVLQYAFSAPDKLVHLKDGLGADLFRRTFGYDTNNVHLVENYIENCVVYTGTHDNNTTAGWFEEELSPLEKEHVLAYCGADIAKFNNHFINKMLYSRANWAITPLQDIIGIGAEGRLNRPGLENGNWNWRFDFDDIKIEEINFMKTMTQNSGRANAC